MTAVGKDEPDAQFWKDAYTGSVETGQKCREKIKELAKALSECADRFERCAIHSGSDKEFAAHAVEDYRKLVADAGALWSMLPRTPK